MKTVIFLLLVVMLSGCGSSVLNIARYSSSSEALVNVEDNRPLAEKNTRSLGFGVTYFPGDDKFEPTIIESLRLSLTNQIKPDPLNKISVEHIEILNYFGAYANASSAAVGASQGIYIPARYKNANFIKCDISGSVNGTKFEVTSTAPYQVKSYAFLVVYNGPDSIRAMEGVTKNCIEIAANKISKLVSDTQAGQ